MNSFRAAALILCMGLPLHGWADDPTIRLVAETAEPVLIGGPLGNDLSLTGQVSLLADSDVRELIFRPSDFHKKDSTDTVSRSQIQLIGGTMSLRANTPQDVTVKFSNVRIPGDFSGSVEFMLPGHGMSSALHVAMILHVEETPKLSLRKGSEAIKIQLVNYSLVDSVLRRPYCALARLFSHPCGAASFALPLDNASQLPFELRYVAASASGELPYHNTGAAIAFPVPIQIVSQPIVSIPFTINAQDLLPDHYIGDIQLRIPGKDEPLRTALELNVRTGPACVILVLIIGVLLGRLIKYMKDKGTPQSDLLWQLLQARSRASQDQTDLAVLQHLLDQTRMEIEQMQLDKAQTDLTLIENRLTLLGRLRYLETLLTPRAADTAVQGVLTNIAQARNQVSLGADPTATATIIETQVQNLGAPAAGVMMPAAHAVEVAAAGRIRAAAPLAVTPVNGAPQAPRVRRIVAALTGHADALRADVTLWFLRPLAWVVLIVLLVITGYIQLYLKNATFGASAVSDYFGLLVWATGSDVASRTLSNFKGT